jgi:hypothetical protein
VHTDVSDPIRKPSLNGAPYFFSFRDDFTGFRFVKKQKIEISRTLKNTPPDWKIKPVITSLLFAVTMAVNIRALNSKLG